MIYYVVFAITLIVFVAFNAFIFPSAFLRFKRLPNFNERGAEYITEKKGKTIIYCPDVRYRGYIKHYALSDRSGKVIVKCEVAKELRYIDYDIRMHDEKGKIFKTRNVKELIGSEGYTRAVELDEKTAYVSIKVNKANGEIIKGDKSDKSRFSSAGVSLYVFFSVIINIAAAFVVKFCVANLLGGLYAEGFLYSFTGNLITLGVGVAVTLLIVIVTLASVKRAALKNKKVGRHG